MLFLNIFFLYQLRWRRSKTWLPRQRTSLKLIYLSSIFFSVFFHINKCMNFNFVFRLFATWFFFSQLLFGIKQIILYVNILLFNCLQHIFFGEIGFHLRNCNNLSEFVPLFLMDQQNRLHSIYSQTKNYIKKISFFGKLFNFTMLKKYFISILLQEFASHVESKKNPN